MVETKFFLTDGWEKDCNHRISGCIPCRHRFMKESFVNTLEEGLVVTGLLAGKKIQLGVAVFFHHILLVVQYTAG